MEKISIEEGQELRKQGYTILLNKKQTDVIAYSKDKDIIDSLYKKGNRIYYPLIKQKVSRQDIIDALVELELGLNCR